MHFRPNRPKSAMYLDEVNWRNSRTSKNLHNKYKRMNSHTHRIFGNQTYMRDVEKFVRLKCSKQCHAELFAPEWHTTLLAQ